MAKTLKNKNIVVGITGGIAAYKSAYLVSRLKREEASVDVIMTKNSTKFITPLTLQALSGNLVKTDMFEDISSAWEIDHISLAKKADIVVIAPATANFLGKVACGIADDLLSTTIMATNAPVLFAPAMNSNMFKNPIVRENIEKLKKSGYIFIGPEKGMLACGDEGEGRLSDIEKIIEKIYQIIF